MLGGALEQIKEFYGDQTAERSGILLMNHITEGLEILDKLGADDSVKEAWCLHPLGQGELPFITDDKSVRFLVNSYAIIANSYLCCPETDHYQMSDMPVITTVGVGQMLYADKLQNYKDFLIAHHGTHPRSEQLNQYFQNWLIYLSNYRK